MEFLKINNQSSIVLQNDFFYDSDNKKPFVLDSSWLEKVIDSDHVYVQGYEIVRVPKGVFAQHCDVVNTTNINSRAIHLISAGKPIFEKLIALSIKNKTVWFFPFLYFYGNETEDIIMLNPEWIRHMNSLFFKNPVNGKKEDSTNNSRFFAYKYQDHICHSFVVTIFGKIFLNTVMVPKFTLEKVILELSEVYGSEKIKAFLLKNDKSFNDSNINNQTVKFLSKGNLLDLINFIYFVKGSIDLPDTEEESDWSKYAWEFIGLWHDSGYDNYTFSFLLDESFKHNSTIKKLPEIYFKSIKLIEKEVINKIKKHLSPEFLSDFNEAIKNTSNFASFIKRFEDNSSGSKNYGRSHALFSGYDFLARYKEYKELKSSSLNMIYTGMDDKKLNLLVHAIIEHHEKNGNFENEFGIKKFSQENDIERYYASDEKQIEGLIQLFIDNPYGHLLRLCDSIAGFARLDIKWSEPDASTQNRKENFKGYFIYDNDDENKMTAEFDNDKNIPLRLKITENLANGSGEEYIEEYNYYLFAKLTKKKLKKSL